MTGFVFGVQLKLWPPTLAVEFHPDADDGSAYASDTVIATDEDDYEEEQAMGFRPRKDHI